MKKILLFLAGAIACAATVYQQQTAVASATQRTVSGTASAINQNGPYFFVWNTQSTLADFINRPPILTPPPSIGPESSHAWLQSVGATISANSYDSNNLWAQFDNSSFPSATWFNLSNSAIFGYSLGELHVEFDWMYRGTVAAGRLMFQAGGKAPGTLYDDDPTPYGDALYSAIVNSGPGIECGSNDIPFNEAVVGAKKKIIYRRNYRTTNPNNAYTRIIYVIENNGATHVSGYETSLTTQPKGPVNHFLQQGNDTPNALNQSATNLIVYGDFPYDIPVNYWWNTEHETLDATNIAANDHNPTLSGTISGTAGRLTTVTGSALNMPCTVNQWPLDNGTRMLRHDLSVTAAHGAGVTFTSSANPRNYGFWIETADLATGTSARVSFTSTVCNVNQGDVGGQETLFLGRNDATVSAAINVTAGAKYWCAVYAVRNGTCRLQVYDVNGALVGSEVTITGTDANIGSVQMGSNRTETAQSAGVYIYTDNLCFDTAVSLRYPVKPWEDS